MIAHERISIPLCTFNGETYLQDQLNSFLDQTVAPGELVVCDDDSQDGSWDILNSFARSAPFPVILERNVPRLGVVANFSKTIRLCSYNYVAPSDQDDIWLPNKLEVSLSALRQAEKEMGSATPLLFHSDLRVVNSRAQLLAPSFMAMENICHRKTHPLKTLLVQNFVTGCTTLANKAMIEACLPIPSEAIMHDWWMALIAASQGKIIFASEPTILYRQHVANVAGAKYFFSLKNFKRIFYSRNLETGISSLLRQALALQKHLSERAVNYPEYLDRYLEGWKEGGMSAVRAGFLNGIFRQGIFRNLVLYGVLARGRYANLQDG